MFTVICSKPQLLYVTEISNPKTFYKVETMYRGKQKGFTLIELMIAMAIMAFGILGFTFLNSRALHNRTFSRDLNRATVVAERIAEDLMFLDYTDPLLTDVNTESPAVATAYPAGSTAASGTIANMSYTVTTSADGLKWFRITQGKQRYYIRWRVVTGNTLVTGSPDDNVKLIMIFAAFEKKDPNTGNITLGGYNRIPSKIVPTIITFKKDPDS